MHTNEKMGYAALGLIIGIVLTGAFFRLREEPGMSHTMDGMTGSLEGKTGDDFDREFLSEMIIHHEGAVKMAEAALSASKRPELVELARGIISAQNAEIGTMREWQQSWFGTGVRYMDIETYVRTYISDLSPVKASLGGTFFVTSIETSGGSGTVEYEDGHDAHVADFSYTTAEDGRPAVTSFTLRK